jgi:hypothetical protein
MGMALAGFAELKPGTLMPFEHAVWRIVETKYIEEHGDRPCTVVVRPISITADDPRSRDHDLHLGSDKYHLWYIYPDEHYPICAACHEPLPCRERMAEQISGQQAERFERFTMAGVCPACQEPVSSRQKSLTMEDNAVVPGGPPVTFHLRAKCWGSAQRYEKQWVALDPGRRKHKLSCAGHLSEHYDGSWSCTEMAECAGEMAQHKSYERHRPGRTDRSQGGTCWCLAGEVA